tara:strand:- start:1201 stop:1410 length:210 start_codon:yes stop_codon:yes gene_type:complete
MTKKYRIKNYALGGEKMGQYPQISICATPAWKDKILRESQMRKMSISNFVRVAVDEKVVREGGKSFPEK